MKMEEIPSLDEMDRINSLITDDEVRPIYELIDKNKMTGDRYSLGLKIFDEAMEGGFKDGDLAIISGISGHGKTSFAQTLTYNLTKLSIPCLWFTYEVSIEHLHGKFEKMGIGEHYFAYAPKKNTTGKLDWIKYKIREGWIKYATKVVFIDHIDFLIPSEVNNSDNQSIALKRIATELKTLAIELNVSIVLMAHLKKLPDNKEPDMQDIGYSAGIFQLADYVFMVIREKEKSKLSQETGDVYKKETIIKIVKNRQTGQNKFIKCIYQNEKFCEIIKTYDEGLNPNLERAGYLYE